MTPRFMMALCVLALTVACLPAQVAADPEPSFFSSAFDMYVTQAMKDWNVPGVSIAILRAGFALSRLRVGLDSVRLPRPEGDSTCRQHRWDERARVAVAAAPSRRNDPYQQRRRLSRVGEREAVDHLRSRGAR